MTEKEIKNRLHQYIVKETMSESNHINDDTLLFEQGIFDSIGLLLLIEFIKNEFNVATSDEELVIENFESINNMEKFITKKLSVK
jgi:acyl carrier protein